MKVILFIALLIAPVLALPLVAWSDAWSAENPTIPREQSPAADMVRLQGVVIEKDNIFQQLTVKSARGRLEQFSFLPTTLILQNGRAVPFGELEVGDRVAVSFTETPDRVARVEKF